MKFLKAEYYLNSWKYFLLNRLFFFCRDLAVSTVVMAVVIWISYLIRIVLLVNNIQ